VGFLRAQAHGPRHRWDFRGPGISGRVLPGGADWQFVDRDGLTLVDAHYVIETADAVRIEVSNPGIRHGAQDVLDRIAAGEPVSPSQYYFRTTPRFHPPDGSTTGSRSRSSWEMLSDMPSW
jgi:hypothetical protein